MYEIRTRIQRPYFISLNNSTMISFTSEQLVYCTFITFQTKKQNITGHPCSLFKCATARCQRYKVNEQNVVNNNGENYLQYGTNQDKHSTLTVSTKYRDPSPHSYSHCCAVERIQVWIMYLLHINTTQNLTKAV